MLDQIAIYAPMMGGLAGSGDVPMPEYPEDANAEEWQRRMHDYETKMDEVRKTGAVTVRKWIDSFRVVDYLGTSATVSGQVEDSAMIVQFAK